MSRQIVYCRPRRRSDFFGRRTEWLPIVCLLAAVCALVIIRQAPRYRATTRILVEHKTLNQVVAGMGTQPALLNPDHGVDISTQLDVLMSRCLLTPACIDAGVPADSASVRVSQVNGTDLVDIVVEAGTPCDAVALANSIPNSYIKYLESRHNGKIPCADDELDIELGVGVRIANIRSVCPIVWPPSKPEVVSPVRDTYRHLVTLANHIRQ